MTCLEYGRKYKNTWLWLFLFVCFCHGSMLLGKAVGIDTEELIWRRGDFYENWLMTGRQGLVLLKGLTDHMTFNPYMAGAMTILFTTGTCLLWTYLFLTITGKENRLGTGLFSFLLVSSTILTEQYYFRLQSMEISLGFCLIAVALRLSWLLAKEKKLWAGLLSVVLMLIVFSEYQAMVALYIFGAAACYFLYCVFRVYTRKEEVTTKELWRIAGRLVLVFLIGFAANQLITVCFFSGSDYLDGQILWQEQPAAECVRGIGEHMQEVLLGRSVYYSKFYAVFFLLLILSLLFFFVRGKAKKGKATGIIALLFLFLAPFYLTLLCGAAPLKRAQLTLPFALAFLAYLLPALPFLPGKYKKLWRAGILLLGILACYTQTRYTCLLNYTDAVRYDSDVRMAAEVMGQIDALQAEGPYPVVFIGARSPQLNYSCVVGETIGHSFFEWDAYAEPRGYYGTGRILGFMHTMGADYRQADREQTAMAVAYGERMPDWPAQGSVVLHDGVIIIRLSGYED